MKANPVSVNLNLSPRWTFPDSTDVSTGLNYQVQLISTAREKEIDLGVNYPYEPLSAGQCIVNSGALGQNPYLQVGSVL